MTTITLTEDEWIDKFKPIKNHLNPGRGYDDCLFETYKEDLKFVQDTWKKTPNRIWTLLDSGTITSGYHYVNRMGYFICQEDANGAINYEVNSDDDEDTQLEADGQCFFDIVVEAGVVIDLVEDLSEHEAGLIYQALKAKFEAPLRAIHAVMDGEDWSPDTLDVIAAILQQAGYIINDTRPPVLEDLVHDAFANAKANGETFETWEDDEIAIDMQSCDQDIADFPIDKIIEAVTKVRNELLQGLFDQKQEAQSDG